LSRCAEIDNLLGLRVFAGVPRVQGLLQEGLE